MAIPIYHRYINLRNRIGNIQLLRALRNHSVLRCMYGRGHRVVCVKSCISIQNTDNKTSK